MGGVITGMLIATAVTWLVYERLGTTGRRALSLISAGWCAFVAVVSAGKEPRYWAWVAGLCAVGWLLGVVTPGDPKPDRRASRRW